jgi:hypothetical protein
VHLLLAALLWISLVLLAVETLAHASSETRYRSQAEAGRLAESITPR